MAAKYQRANVKLREEQQFTLNGRKMTTVDVSEGGKRMKNVGQMVGASADNGKDPNLSDMGSTTKTAPMIGYMLRLGMSHLEAALVINQPHMRDSKYSSKYKEHWDEVLGKRPLSVPVGNVTTDMLIKSLVDPENLTPEEDKAIAGLCYRILCQHEAQEYLTNISRADSPNGSLQNTYAKARLQQYKVDLFQAKMGQNDFPFIRITEALSNDAVDVSAPEEVVREQLKKQPMGLLHGMYALGIHSFERLVRPYFFGAEKWFDDEIVKPILYNLKNAQRNDKEEETTKVIDNIYKSYITYILSGSPLFGNEESATFKQKRDYYREAFPDDYQKILAENEEIRDLLSSVLQVKNEGSRKRIVLQDVGSLSKGQKADVQRRFDRLPYMGKEGEELAKKLLIYSYYDNGLQFTHDSFSTLFTTEFLIGFAAYTDTLNGLDVEITDEQKGRFIEQFLVTYPDVAYKVDDFVTEDNFNPNDRNILMINLADNKVCRKIINEVMSPNPRSEGVNVYPYINYQGDIYILNKDAYDQFPNIAIYRKVDKYGTFPKAPLFTMEYSLAQLAQDFPVTESAQQDVNAPDIDVDGIDTPMAHDTSNEDPALTNDMYGLAYDSNDVIPDDFDLDVEPDAPQSKSEKYDNEGEGELQTPFC